MESDSRTRPPLRQSCLGDGCWSCRPFGLWSAPRRSPETLGGHLRNQTSEEVGRSCWAYGCMLAFYEAPFMVMDLLIRIRRRAGGQASLHTVFSQGHSRTVPPSIQRQSRTRPCRTNRRTRRTSTVASGAPSPSSWFEVEAYEAPKGMPDCLHLGRNLDKGQAPQQGVDRRSTVHLLRGSG